MNSPKIQEDVQSRRGTSTFIGLVGPKGKYSLEKMNLWKWTPLYKPCNSWAASFLSHKKAYENVFKNKFPISFHFCLNGSFFYFTSTDSLAPPVKQKARFKIKDAKCHLRPRSKEKTKDSGKQAVSGRWFLPACKQHFNLFVFLFFCMLCFHTADRKKNYWFSYFFWI